MKPLDLLRVRAMEVRVRLAELATAELTDESRTEMDTLRNEYTDLERRQAALMIADDTPAPVETADTAEGREYRDLRNAASFSRYVAAAMAGKGVSGRGRTRTEPPPTDCRQLFQLADAGRARLRGARKGKPATPGPHKAPGLTACFTAPLLNTWAYRSALFPLASWPTPSPPPDRIHSSADAPKLSGPAPTPSR